MKQEEQNAHGEGQRSNERLETFSQMEANFGILFRLVRRTLSAQSQSTRVISSSYLGV
jgi:hypothetical protein